MNNLTLTETPVKRKITKNSKTSKDADLRLLARETLVDAGIWSLLTGIVGNENAVLDGFLNDFDGLLAAVG